MRTIGSVLCIRFREISIGFVNETRHALCIGVRNALLADTVKVVVRSASLRVQRVFRGSRQV